MLGLAVAAFGSAAPVDMGHLIRHPLEREEKKRQVKTPFEQDCEASILSLDTRPEASDILHLPLHIYPALNV